MRAVQVKEPGGPGHLFLGDYPMPTPADHELLVRVGATALNRADLMQRAGLYPPPPGVSEILGLEASGVVEAVGASCEGWRVGDRVFGLLPGGGYASYVVLDYRMAMRMPEGMSFEEAAAIPEVFLTAYQALFWLGGMATGSRVLVHAGASGVGTAALQMIRQTGAQAYATASAPKHARCLELGAAVAIDYREEDFADRILAVTAGQGVNIVLDVIGAPYFEKNVRSLAVDGRLVLLSMLGGGRVEQVNLAALFRKRIHLITTTLRSRSPDYKIDLTQAFASAMLPHFESGQLGPVIDSVFDWRDVQAAHRYMEGNKNVGKIVLRVGEAEG